MQTELLPKFDSRKSFYGKARVEHLPGNVVLLHSYSTNVVSIHLDSRKVFLYSRWNESQTTLRHVKEFLKQNGFKAETKAQIEKDYS